MTAVISLETTPVAHGRLTVLPMPHPQGCRTYLVGEQLSGDALAIDCHLDLVETVAAQVAAAGWTLRYVVDTHTHADHPSGSAALAARFGATRVAHQAAGHQGVTLHPADGEPLALGDTVLEVRHAPGHTPDHMVLLAAGIVFSGDSLFIGGVARADFLGGNAEQLFGTLRDVFGRLTDEVVVYPGHDYAGLIQSTMGAERARNPWLGMTDGEEFARQLTADRPPLPANMGALIDLNRGGVAIPASIPARRALTRVTAGGAGSVIDVRTDIEYEAERIPGSRHIPLHEVTRRADEVRATPAPRLLLCRTASRAAQAQEVLQRLGIGGSSVVEGGVQAYHREGGTTVSGHSGVSLESQVRIAAAALMLVAICLGAFVHAGFLVLAALIALGQIYAGVTNRCGMGLVLARMPWNRRGKSGQAPTAAGACAAPPPPGGCAAAPPGE